MLMYFTLEIYHDLSRFITIFAKYENSTVQFYGFSITYYGHK